MLTPYQAIIQLRTTNSRLEKVGYIKHQANVNNTEFFEGCRLALDNMITFGVKKVPIKKDADGPGLSWEDFLTVANDLRSRKLTGNAAKAAIDTLMASATDKQWNRWYRLILIKDLKCGVNVKTLNSAIMDSSHPEFTVPVFQCQLAKDIDKHAAKGVGKKLLEFKLDGVRVLTVVYPNGEVTQYSRSGKEFNNFTAIKERFATVAYTLTKPLVFDGEVMSTSFQDLMKQARREENVETENLQLNLFDVIPLEDFLKGKCQMPQASRSAYLNLWYSENSYALPNINVLPQLEVDLDTEEGIAEYNAFNDKALIEGYEGIMVKDPLAPYECKVGTNWMKRKPFIEVTLAVIGYEEGEGQFEGSLGALICQGVDDGIAITVTVGGGFTPQTRAEIWADRENVVGRMVEVRAGEITQNQNGNYSLRFPRFKCFRGFEKGEKL
jgi:DNA ligase-1